MPTPFSYIGAAVTSRELAVEEFSFVSKSYISNSALPKQVRSCDKIKSCDFLFRFACLFLRFNSRFEYLTTHNNAQA